MTLQVATHRGLLLERYVYTAGAVEPLAAHAHATWLGSFPKRLEGKAAIPATSW